MTNVLVVGASVLAWFATGNPLAALVPLVLLLLFIAAARIKGPTPATEHHHDNSVPQHASRVTPTSSARYENDSCRQHSLVPMQTWKAFLNESFRQQRNSGAHVKVGDGFEIGIVGESFYQSELEWIRSNNSDSSRYRTRFLAYLIPEPENPHGRQGRAVRVESPRGRTIGHLSNEHADEYVQIFAVLREQARVGVCRASAVGGTERKRNIGVWITIGHPAWMTEQIVEALRPRPPRKKRERRAIAPPDQPF